MSSASSSSSSASLSDSETEILPRNPDEDSEEEASDAASSSSDESDNSVEEEDDVPVLSHKEQRRQKKKELRQQKAEAAAATDGLSAKQKGKQPVKNTAELAPSKLPKRQNSVWVGNLTFKTTPDALRKFFDGVGEITRIHMPMKMASGGPGGGGARKENRG
ncbi:hypothetical protein DAEQUDRAFT_722625 [Daedalea quercina L-15889]|uniref:RRM domain-containing protein n=1 Tax=Daedalea quercina L-15889 TaxID=1314783 RepID=A0A165STS9_9APHY|nr:hypothetical protein DAEQUDRAFT_722625 [Daedalea quercina L-15889]